jgi:hypothetical protein
MSCLPCSICQANIQDKLSPANLKIELLLVAVNNTLQKPGPVFLEMARAAYKQGADYFYRVNDDTELLNPWVIKFVSAFEVRPQGLAAADTLRLSCTYFGGLTCAVC